MNSVSYEYSVMSDIFDNKVSAYESMFGYDYDYDEQYVAIEAAKTQAKKGLISRIIEWVKEKVKSWIMKLKRTKSSEKPKTQADAKAAAGVQKASAVMQKTTQEVAAATVIVEKAAKSNDLDSLISRLCELKSSTEENLETLDSIAHDIENLDNKYDLNDLERAALDKCRVTCMNVYSTMQKVQNEVETMQYSKDSMSNDEQNQLQELLTIVGKYKQCYDRYDQIIAKFG